MVLSKTVSFMFHLINFCVQC